MSLMTAITTLATLLWCYALVLTVAWVRAVGATDRREHVGHFIGLMGVFVPGIALTVATVIVAAAIGLPQIVVAIVLMLPASVAVGLHLELGRLLPSDGPRDAGRLALAVGLAALSIALG